MTNSVVLNNKDGITAYISELEEITYADKVKNILSATLPEREVGEVDVTDFDSTGKEFEGDTPDYGTLEIKYLLKNTEQYEKYDDWADEEKTVNFMVFTHTRDNRVVIGKKGKGFAKANKVENLERDSRIEVTLSIRVSGATERTKDEPVENAEA